MLQLEVNSELGLAWQLEIKVCAEDPEVRRGACRADAFVRYLGSDLMVEFDPRQHSGNAISDESDRQTRLEAARTSAAGAWTVTSLRVNTSGYRDEAGHRVTPSVGKVLRALDRAIRDFAVRARAAQDGHRSTAPVLEFLFYDRARWNRGKVSVATTRDVELLCPMCPRTVRESAAVGALSALRSATVSCKHVVAVLPVLADRDSCIERALGPLPWARAVHKAAPATIGCVEFRVYPPEAPWRDVRVVLLDRTAFGVAEAVAEADASTFRWFPRRERRWQLAIAYFAGAREALEHAAAVAAARRLTSGPAMTALMHPVDPDRAECVLDTARAMSRGVSGSNHRCVCFRAESTTRPEWAMDAEDDARAHASLVRAVHVAFDMAAVRTDPAITPHVTKSRPQRGRYHEARVRSFGPGTDCAWLERVAHFGGRTRPHALSFVEEVALAWMCVTHLRSWMGGRARSLVLEGGPLALVRQARASMERDLELRRRLHARDCRERERERARERELEEQERRWHAHADARKRSHAAACQAASRQRRERDNAIAAKGTPTLATMFAVRRT